MQHDKPKINALRKNNRLRNAQTPDKTENSLMNASTLSVSSPRRRINSFSRQSTASHGVLNSTANLRKMEMEHFNLEYDLVYGEFIQSMAELVIATKKSKETEGHNLKLIQKLSAEVKSLDEKCHILEERKNNIKLLSNINNYEDTVQSHLKDIEKEQKRHELQNILSDLEKLLSKFNVLRCENILLPTTTDEMMELKQALTNCLSELQQISNPVECKILENLANCSEEFSKVAQEISQIKNMVEEDICHLQSEVLCKCSNIFSRQGDKE